MKSYAAFLSSKSFVTKPAGFKVESLNPHLFAFQRDITRWGLAKGKAAIFADCGTGKSLMELDWAHHVSEHTNKPVIEFAPLGVSRQTVSTEAPKFGFTAARVREQSEVQPGINVTNYEQMKNFDPREFGGIVIDESSILKGDGPMRKDIVDFAQHIPYRLAATATPAPNDHMELGNHAEFLGIMSKSEMLSTFFVHDGKDTSKWRLKGHAESAFWKWVASWAVMIRKPSDLGYDDGAFVLPPITYHQHTVKAEWSADYLFPVEAKTMKERQGARRDSLPARVKLCADLVNASDDRWVCWCNLNPESEALADSILRAVEVTGSQKDAAKEQALLDFCDGKIDRLVTKPKIAGWGMNMQICNKAAVVGLSDSWEQLYQVVRRIWRFGQKSPVDIHVITGELEGAVVRNIERKEAQAAKMAESMLGHMREINQAEIHGTIRETEAYAGSKKVKVPKWL